MDCKLNFLETAVPKSAFSNFVPYNGLQKSNGYIAQITSWDPNLKFHAD